MGKKFHPIEFSALYIRLIILILSNFISFLLCKPKIVYLYWCNIQLYDNSARTFEYSTVSKNL